MNRFVGFALVCVSCLTVVFWWMQPNGTNASAESAAIFQTKAERDAALGILKPVHISKIISMEYLTIPFSDFSKVSTINLTEAFARCIPGDPRYSPLMESLSGYFKDPDGQNQLNALYFRNMGNSEQIEVEKLLDNSGLKFSWQENQGTAAGFLWIFSVAFSVYVLFGLRSKHDLAFRALITIPWIILAVLVPTVLGTTISILGCAVSVSIFMLHEPVKNSNGTYRLSGMGTIRVLYETVFYCIPAILFLVIEKTAIPFFFISSALEFAIFRYMDFFIGHFRKKLSHEPPVFRLIIKKSPVSVKYLNYGITCFSVLLVFAGTFAAPRFQSKSVLIDYKQLYEHAALQHDVTFGRYRKEDRLVPGEAVLAVFSRAPKDSRLIKTEQNPLDKEARILRSLQDSTCIEIAGNKQNTEKTISYLGKSDLPTSIPLSKGYLFLYIVAFIPILLSNVRGVFISSKVYLTKTNIRQEA